MNEDSISDPQNDSAAEGSNKELAKALEVLVARAPFRNTAQNHEKIRLAVFGAGACPSEGDWFLLTAGELPADRRQALLTHAALCTSCLARLRQSQSLISGEPTPEEAEELKRFSSTTPQWQHRLAVELAQTQRKSSRSGRLIVFGWLSGGLAAALVLALVGTVWWRNQNAPEKLLAEAYVQARMFDLRVPGAGFSPVSPRQHLRGGASDREPVPLLTARAAIERKLQQSPSDPHWLQLQARAEILDEHYDRAIDTLDRLLASGPTTADLLLDDGTAYYLRGTATGSENDRATALDDLRRADELAPNDPVILFNEAIVMEDRGQVMNAVETWNRFLKFERNPKWLEEGRQRLASLEEKLNRIKTHGSRMEQHLATPQSMRALASDSATLSGIDEEFSTTMLPRLLDAAFPLPIDRSRGSPCAENCAAARSLLVSLAASLELHHQDSWLKEFLPSDFSRMDNQYSAAAHALGRAIGANARSDYASAEQWADRGRQLFHALRIPAGEDRATIERVYAEQRSFTFAHCQQDAEQLIAQHNRFTWIRAQATALAADCDMSPGAASRENHREAFRLAQMHRYLLLELRARNGMASWAVQYGDNEDAWRLELEAIRCFYAGDFPPFRVATFMSGLLMVEENSPRVHLALLINEEEVGLFDLAQSPVYAAGARGHLIRAALRAGALREAEEQMRIVQREIASLPSHTFPPGFRAENELGLADVYLDRGDLAAAQQQLDAARGDLDGDDNYLQRAHYAAESGELDLTLGHPEKAEATLRNAILVEESRSLGAGEPSEVSARQDRSLYAALAAVWLAEDRPSLEVLALWERYRMRILGEPVAPCNGARLDCLKAGVQRVLDRDFATGKGRRLIGQMVLRDRTLLYRADANGVAWSQHIVRAADVFSAVASLEHVASTPASPQASIDQAAHRVGDLLLDASALASSSPHTILLETDPVLGNLPWPAADTAEGPIGLRFDLEELPSLLLEHRNARSTAEASSLVVGASVAAGESQPLPEALDEARIVAHDDLHSSLLLAANATEPHVATHLASATIIHFAGHAMQYQGETRLLLAPSGQVGDKPYLDEALLRRNPPRAAQLVVFSACSTGKREEGWDHGMGDIVDTLAFLGVPEVVATRWQIDSASAVPMMDAFYRGLSNGRSVAQALTAARQSLIRDARYRHPYYWAPYYASGVGTTDFREVFHGSSN